MAQDYSQLAQTIVDNVGGKENIVSLARCITRLRFKLKDESLVNDDVLSATEGIIQVLHAPGQTHVVVGQKVDLVYDAVLALDGVNAGGEVPIGGNNEDKGVLATMIDLISNILAPVLAVISAGGILKGLLALWAFLDPNAAATGAYTMLSAAGDGSFYFLPIFLAYTSAKKFNCNEFTAMAIATALVYPSMVAMPSSGDALGSVLSGTPFAMSYYATFLGIPIIFPPAGYTSSVVPIIIAIWFSSKVEAFVKPKYPDFLRFFLVPLTVITITVPLTYLIIGPVSAILCGAIQLLFESVNDIPVIGHTLLGCLVAGLWQPLVFFGLHWAIFPLALTNMATIGYDYVTTPAWACSFAVVATILAMYLKTGSKTLRDAALPTMFTGFFGVTEPAVYGVLIGHMNQFVICCLASAVGGAIGGWAQVKTFQMGGMSFFQLPGSIDPTPVAAGGEGIHSVIWMLIGAVASSAIAFAVTYATYKDEGKDLVDTWKAA